MPQLCADWTVSMMELTNSKHCVIWFSISVNLAGLSSVEPEKARLSLKWIGNSLVKKLRKRMSKRVVN